MKYVLDTNTWIYFFKGVGQVSTHLLRTPPQEIGIPSVVVYELEVGIAKSTAPEKRRAQLATLLASLTILPFGLTEAQHAAHIRSALEAPGLRISTDRPIFPCQHN